MRGDAFPRNKMKLPLWSAIALALLLCPNAAVLAQGDVIELSLPTDNDALFHGGGAAFYQYVDRDYKGVKSTPWEGGQYGFVRDPLQTAIGIVYTRFHEGMDIRCLQRNESGEPLDEVRAIAVGRVAYTSLVAGHSNYGKYVVIEHRWGGSPYYSLYAHLSAIEVHAGQTVHGGQRIGIMGYTGTGLSRARAHVHLELNLMISHHFQAWYDHFYPNDPNYHGIYNGINLDGMDIAQLFLQLHKNPSLTIPQFLGAEETFYKVTIPRSGYFELPRFYPWMVKGGADKKTASWEVSFAQSGLPLKIEPSDKKVSGPQLTYVKKSGIDYSDLTFGNIAGRGKHAHLTEHGQQMMRLLTYPD
jgi:murein DD-endopeptidase MepM/ murein hydrolase activator NlpD